MSQKIICNDYVPITGILQSTKLGFRDIDIATDVSILFASCIAVRVTSGNTVMVVSIELSLL